MSVYAVHQFSPYEGAVFPYSGGRNESLHMTNGQADVRQAEDQLAQDRSVSALFHNYESGTPLVLLMDDRYPFFPYDIAAKGVMYAVLGIYRVTYVWGRSDVLLRYAFC